MLINSLSRWTLKNRRNFLLVRCCSKTIYLNGFIPTFKCKKPSIQKTLQWPWTVLRIRIRIVLGSWVRIRIKI
jgi:hypothetical protein